MGTHRISTWTSWVSKTTPRPRRSLSLCKSMFSIKINLQKIWKAPECAKVTCSGILVLIKPGGHWRTTFLDTSVTLGMLSLGPLVDVNTQQRGKLLHTGSQAAHWEVSVSQVRVPYGRPQEVEGRRAQTLPLCFIVTHHYTKPNNNAWSMAHSEKQSTCENIDHRLGTWLLMPVLIHLHQHNHYVETTEIL